MNGFGGRPGVLDLSDRRAEVGSQMLKSKLASFFADPYGAAAIVRRLLTEEGVKHWRGYALCFVLMGIAAGCTSISAYLIGKLVNQAYVQRDFAGIVALGVFTVVLFAVKGG